MGEIDHRHLVIALALENQHRLVQSLGFFGRLIEYGVQGKRCVCEAR